MSNDNNWLYVVCVGLYYLVLSRPVCLLTTEGASEDEAVPLRPLSLALRRKPSLRGKEAFLARRSFAELRPVESPFPSHPRGEVVLIVWQWQEKDRKRSNCTTVGGNSRKELGYRIPTSPSPRAHVWAAGLDIHTYYDIVVCCAACSKDFLSTDGTRWFVFIFVFSPPPQRPSQIEKEKKRNGKKATFELRKAAGRRNWK